MIHSLSGGVLSDGTVYDFAKVRVEGVPRWYLAAGAKAGDKVVVPFGEGKAEGVVERVERCTPQTTPCSLRHARSILEILERA